MENEKRLIDANAYCKELYLERDYPGRSEEFISAMEVAIADLGDMPTVDAVEVVHGRWEKQLGIDHCSVCHKVRPYDVQADVVQYWQCDYCPNCGASMMDGDGNGN